MEKQKKILITADNSLIYYEVSGQGTPLFLLHGNGGSGKYFEHQVSEFSREFEVFTVDSRGHGRSTNQSGRLNFEQMADDLYQLMIQEQLTRADFLGFSDGANVAMLFAKKYPDLVHRLVLNAGNTKVSGVFFPIRLLTKIQYLCLKLLAPISEKAKKQLPIIQLLLNNIGITTFDLRRISAKTLVIVGRFDLIKKSHSLYLVKEIPNATFVLIPGQGHSFAKRNPKLFNKEILTFLKKSR